MRPYAWGSITVNPNPPRVGEVTRIGFPLANPGPGEVIVERIDVRVAGFGMGVGWEDAGSLGPITLAPDPNHVEETFVEWTPTTGGHRCVRAQIYVQGMESALTVGRNLDVIEAGATETRWGVPFHLGNPEPVRAPIVLRLEQEAESDSAFLRALLRVDGRPVAPGQPVWLEPGQEVAAELHLVAPPGQALAAAQRVEAWIGDRLIDGIEVAIHRPALARPQPPAWDDGERAGVLVGARELAAVI
jgi:hypothetical protein